MSTVVFFSGNKPTSRITILFFSSLFNFFMSQYDGSLLVVGFLSCIVHEGLISALPVNSLIIFSFSNHLFRVKELRDESRGSGRSSDHHSGGSRGRSTDVGSLVPRVPWRTSRIWLS